MKETKIICDNCKNPIVPSPHMPKHFISLIDRELQPFGDMVYNVMINPVFEFNPDLCGLACLKEWVNKL